MLHIRVCLGEYHDLFRDESLDELSDMNSDKITNETLKEIGIDSFGHRLRILYHVRLLCEQNQANPLIIDEERREIDADVAQPAFRPPQIVLFFFFFSVSLSVLFCFPVTLLWLCVCDTCHIQQNGKEGNPTKGLPF